MLFLMVDVYVLKETAFWISGAFNYIFPTLAAILVLQIAQTILASEKKHPLLFLLLFFLSATTEQGFVMSFIFATGAIVFAIIEQKKLNYKMVFIPFTQALSFLSMVLSPASRLRAAQTKTIFNYPIHLLFQENWGDLLEILVGEHSIKIILLLAFGSIVGAICCVACHLKFNRHRIRAA